MRDTQLCESWVVVAPSPLGTAGQFLASGHEHGPGTTVQGAVGVSLEQPHGVCGHSSWLFVSPRDSGSLHN